jgi:polysaccharide export outer membrane protein
VRLLKGSPYDIELEDGDDLTIPMENSVVSVVGSVMTEQASFVYEENLTYKNYVEMSGGYTRYADTDNVYVLKVDGSARKLSRGFVSWNSGKSRWEVSAFGEKVKEIEPGDTIIVPEKLEHVAWLREVKDITQILMQMAVTAGVVIKVL